MDIKFSSSRKENCVVSKMLHKATCYFAMKDRQQTDELNFLLQLGTLKIEPATPEIKNHTAEFFRLYNTIYS